MTAHLDAQRGVTLIELVLSMVMISIALVGILSVMNLNAARSADPLIEHQAIAIAEAYLEEISLKAFAPGPGSQRADFDDIDDYNGLSDDGVRDQLGNAVAGLAQYAVSVVITDTALAGGVNAKRIDVSVTGPDAATLTLTGYRSQR